MSSAEILVLDASVGVKWFKPEAGQDTAIEILRGALAGKLTVAVPTHFMHEVLSFVRRYYEPPDVVPAWEDMRDAGITVLPLTDEIMREAAHQCGVLGCSFYDALAPACATLLGATLVSADARAHGRFPGVRLVGE